MIHAPVVRGTWGETLHESAVLRRSARSPYRSSKTFACMIRGKRNVAGVRHIRAAQSRSFRWRRARHAEAARLARPLRRSRSVVLVLERKP